MRTIITTLIIILSLNCFSQEKKDTTIQTTLTIADYRALLYTIDANIDSKKISSDVVSFIQKHSVIVPIKTDSSSAKNPKK